MNDALLFDVSNDQTCFLEEVPGESVLIAEFTSFIDNDLVLNLYDPLGEVVLAHIIPPSKDKGKVAFHAMSPGMYKYCLNTKENGKSGRFELILDLKGKNYKVDTSVLPKTEHLNSVTDQINELSHQVDLLLIEMDYAHHQNNHFAAQANDINYGIVFWSCIQIVFILGVGIWQVLHLRAFFGRKKFA